jgi:hypothetical protein
MRSHTHRPVPANRKTRAHVGGAAQSGTAWVSRYLAARSFESAGDIDKAIRALEEVVRTVPQEQAPRFDLGILYTRVRRYPDALRELYEVSERFPNDGKAAVEVAKVLLRLGQPKLALTFVRRALALDSMNVVAMLTLAMIFKDLGSVAASRDIYEAALTIAPNDAALRMPYGMTLVLLGEWLRGWKELESREAYFGTEFLYGELPKTPRWDGRSSLEGKRLLIVHEQGLGDSIMGVRFAEELASRGATVHFRTEQPLVALLGASRGVDECSVHRTPLPEHDLHIPLMSLMHALEVTPDRTSGTPYLEPQGACPVEIATRLPLDEVLTVGLTWAGNPLHENDHRRSIPGALLAPLLQLPGVRFVALQKSPPVERVLPAELQQHVVDIGAYCDSFNDSAHALRRMDVLISVDTSVAHLAGALGVPTLLCLPQVPDYRWGLTSATTPWYNSMTLLRQQEHGNWEGVLADAQARTQALRDKLATRARLPHIINESEG